MKNQHTNIARETLLVSDEIILIGSGGHAKVLFEIAQSYGIQIHGVATLEEDIPDFLSGLPRLTDQDILSKNPSNTRLINGIGSLPFDRLRQIIYEKFTQCGFKFLSLISKHSVISESASLGDGVNIMAGVVLQAQARIGANTIINTSSSIDHDCIIGKHSHIAPGVTLSGLVAVGNNVHIGTGAIVIQSVSIGDNALVAAGSVIYKNVPANARVKTQGPMLIEPISS